MPVVLTHELPGRLRFSLPGLRRDGRGAAQLRDRLAPQPGVGSVSVSALTGSVLVIHDGRAATRERIIGMLQAVAGAAAGGRPVLRTPVHCTAAAAQTLLHRSIEVLLEHALRAMLAAMA